VGSTGFVGPLVENSGLSGGIEQLRGGRMMKRLSHLALFLALVVVVAACGRYETGEETAAAVEEIPVTTASVKALGHFRVGQKALDVGRGQQAREHFEAAVGEDPRFAYAYLNIAAAAPSTQVFKENLDLAAQNLDGKSDAERLLVEISQTFVDNNAERRVELAQQLVEIYPNSPRAWLTLAGIQGGLNRHQEARASMEKALQLNSEMMAAHSAMGLSYLFNEPKDFTKAQVAIERCIELDPQEAKGYEYLGDVHRAMKDLEGAAQQYTTAMEVDPGLVQVAVKTGHVNSFLGSFDEARAAYDTAVDGAKEATKAFYANYRAFTHLHQGDPAGALQELHELYDAIDEMMPANQADGPKIFTLTNAAVIALHNNLFEASEGILVERAEVVRANAAMVGNEDFARQQEANILLWKGQLAARQGDFETARSDAEENRALLENDTNPRRFEGYHGLMGLIELLAGNHSQAVEHYRQANLNSMYVNYHLALAEEGAGNSEVAGALFKEVAEWNFNSVGYALVRADAMGRTG
jgi:tetratricopeptide (TPR) repeat protein